jgi:hypothetical protein
MGQEPGWETLAQRYGGEAPAERVRGSWAAAAAACAPGEGHSIALAEERERQVTAELREAQAALEERDVSLAKLTSQLATVRADSEARIVGLEAQLREASMTAALEAQTSADLRAVNDALRAQLAEATRMGVEWVTDGNTLRLVVRRVTEASVGAVVSSDRGADWTVRVSGGPSAQGFEPGDASTEQAKRIVEMVAGVRP